MDEGNWWVKGRLIGEGLGDSMFRGVRRGVCMFMCVRSVFMCVGSVFMCVGSVLMRVLDVFMWIFRII